MTVSVVFVWADTGICHHRAWASNRTMERCQLGWNRIIGSTIPITHLLFSCRRQIIERRLASTTSGVLR